LTSATIGSAALAAIRRRFEGEVLEAGDPNYDDARKLFNAMIDRRPRLIVRCTGAPDVIAGIQLARETGLPLAVKSGGHGVNGHAVCDDGFVLDLSPLRQITVDEVGGAAAFLTPPVPFVPPELQGRRAVGVVVTVFAEPSRAGARRRAGDASARARHRARDRAVQARRRPDDVQRRHRRREPAPAGDRRR
jgi:hypothetical protein